MKTATLLRIWLVLGGIWLFVFGPGLWARVKILRHAAQYNRTEMVVTRGYCIGGQRHTDRDGHTSTDPRYCFLAGTIAGNEVELSVGSTLPPGHAPGSRLRVLYNPAMPAFGVNYENERLLEDDGDGTGRTGAEIVSMLGFVLWSFAATAAAHVWFRWSVGRRGGAATLPAGLAGLGQGLLGQGCAFLAVQIPHPAWGGVALGLLLAGAGGAVLRTWWLSLR